MAEFRNPSQQNGDSRQLLVALAVVMACTFFGLRLFTGAHGLAHLPAAIASHGGEANTSGSMNIIERQLFAALSVVQAHMPARSAGTWGWAIVALTLAINFMLLPLRIAGMRSGMKMQRIQPAISAIRSRYKNVKLTDPRHNEMAAEIEQLQKDNGVNMFGGCLPLLIQMPLLFAFFGMLRKAAPLHGATWLWLHDLSSADPSHILPVLMCLFQLLVQLYTPSPGTDARQQKVMACVMTVGFGYVSWHYASGLALYALTGSLFAIATQMVMNVLPLGREMKAIRSANAF